jgi:diamine N-acetyltransferase
MRALVRAGVDDFPLIAQLAHRIWPVCYTGVLTPEQIQNILGHLYTPSSLAQQAAEGQVFWLLNDPQTVGFAATLVEGDVVWLKKLYVLTESQGAGIGRWVVERLSEQYKEAQEMRLYVNLRNAPARAFYERVGFEKVAEVPVRMGDYDFADAVYVKTL